MIWCCGESLQKLLYCKFANSGCTNNENIFTFILKTLLLEPSLFNSSTLPPKWCSVSSLSKTTLRTPTNHIRILSLLSISFLHCWCCAFRFACRKSRRHCRETSLLRNFLEIVKTRFSGPLAQNMIPHCYATKSCANVKRRGEHLHFT